MTKEHEREQVTGSRDLLPLPERSGAAIRKGVFELVNGTLQEAFPEQFGNIIPILNPQDVHIVREKDSLVFKRKDLERNTHSYLQKQLTGVMREFHNSTFDSLLSQEVRVSFTHLTGYPGAPILFPASQLEITSPQSIPADLRRGVNDLIIARHLLHENIHRAQRYRGPEVTTPDDPLFSLGFFSTLMLEKETKDEDEKKALQDMNERLKEYALDHGPEVAVSGAKIEVWCTDERDGKRSIIAQSGYDLNEAFTEHFVIIALPHLYRLGEQRYDPRLVQILKEDLLSSPGGSQRVLDLFPIVPKYLDELDIPDTQTALEAFANGDLPAIHAERLSSKFYFS